MEFSDKIQKEHNMKTGNRMAKVIKEVFAVGTIAIASALYGNYCYNNISTPITREGCSGMILEYPEYLDVADLENEVSGVYSKDEKDFIGVYFKETNEYFSLRDAYIPAERLQPAIMRLEDIQKCIEGK